MKIQKASGKKSKKMLVAKFALPLVIMGSAPVVAYAEDMLGCTFALCIASPNPMGIAECVSPVKTVLKRLAKGKSLPTCALVNANGQTSTNTSIPKITYARANPIPPCPAGQTYGKDGVIYHTGNKPSGLWDNPFTITNISGGSQSIKNGSDDSIALGQSPYSSRVCIGGQSNGTYADRVQGNDGDLNTIVHEWRDSVSNVTADGATWEFHTVVDNNYQTVHRF